MIRNLLFDFSVNKESKTIEVKREFAADVEMVWTAWTKPQLLDLWWAPKPFQAKTKSMDFREGGSWLYAMVGPDNSTHWSRADYKKIDPLKSFSGLDAFCNEDGEINNEFPSAFWTVSFAENGQTTLVYIQVTYQELSDLEKIIQLGFKEGFTAALGNLDKYIESQFKLRSELHTGNGSRV